MSVIVSKRKVSSMQFYKTARDLRRDIGKNLEETQGKLIVSIKNYLEVQRDLFISNTNGN